MKKRDYLSDYKMTASGEYIYMGKYFTYTDRQHSRKNRTNLIFLSFLTAIFVVFSGCINSSGMSNSFYVILPFIAEAICVFILCYNTFRLCTQKDEIKEYIYRATTKIIPDSAKALMFFSAVGLVATIVYFILNHQNGYSFVYPVLKIITFLIAFLLIRLFNSISFEQK